MNLSLSFALFEKFKAFILRGPWKTEFYFEWRKGGKFGGFVFCRYFIDNQRNNIFYLA